jgi:hypothetical protein
MTDARLPHSVPARHRWDSIHGGRGDAAMKVHAPAHRPQRPDEHEGITAPGKPLDAVAPDYTRLTADQAGAALTKRLAHEGHQAGSQVTPLVRR